MRGGGAGEGWREIGERCPSTLTGRAGTILRVSRNGQNHEIPLVEAVCIGQGWPGSPKATDFNAFMNAGLPT